MLWLSKNRKWIISAILVFALLASIGFTSQRYREITTFESFVVDAFSTIQKPFQTAGSVVSRFFDQISQIRTLKQDNESMRKELEEIRSEYLHLIEREKENQRLRELLDFKEETPFETLSASVVGRSSTHWYGTITLDQGSRDGVKRDMSVVTGKGLVGRVTNTTDRTCTVLLLMDPDSGVGAYVQRTRDQGVVLGQPGRENLLEMRLFSRESQVEEGDPVLSSGLGEIFPREIPIGTVESVVMREYGLTMYALITPYVDFDRLEEVLILKTSQEN